MNLCTYVINGTIKWRKQSLRATTFAIAKLDNYIGINSERQFNSAPIFFCILDAPIVFSPTLQV